VRECKTVLIAAGLTAVHLGVLADAVAAWYDGARTSGFGSSRQDALHFVRRLEIGCWSCLVRTSISGGRLEGEHLVFS
jgi:hypothetical protein